MKKIILTIVLLASFLVADDYADAEQARLSGNYTKAIVLYKKSAKSGNPSGFHSLGNIYKVGLGTKQDLKESFAWYKKSADMGYAPSQYNVALMYLDGIGVEKDEKNAFKWMEQSALRGHVNAQFNLGVMFYNGTGVEADFKKSKYWIITAGNNDSKEAQKFYSEFGLDRY